MPAPFGLSPRWPIRPHECDVRVTRLAVGRYPMRQHAIQVQEATAARLRRAAHTEPQHPRISTKIHYSGLLRRRRCNHCAFRGCHAPPGLDGLSQHAAQ